MELCAVLAVVGCVFVSAFAIGAIAAPTDGQTGMCCCPFLLFGVVLTAAALIVGTTQGASRGAWLTVWSTVLIDTALSVASVIAGNRATKREPDEGD